MTSPETPGPEQSISWQSLDARIARLERHLGLSPLDSARQMTVAEADPGPRAEPTQSKRSRVRSERRRVWARLDRQHRILPGRGFPNQLRIKSRLQSSIDRPGLLSCRGFIPNRDALEDTRLLFVALTGEWQSLIAFLYNDALALLLLESAGRQFIPCPFPDVGSRYAKPLSCGSPRFANTGRGRNSIGNRRRASNRPDPYHAVSYSWVLRRRGIPRQPPRLVAVTKMHALCSLMPHISYGC